MERYPSDSVVTREDFLNSRWREILGTVNQKDYSLLWQIFSDAARNAIAEETPIQGKVFWLLADACSMRLVPGSFNDPFKPFIVMEGRRSVIPDDFKSADIAFFADIYSEIDDAKLRARLADLVWLKRQQRKPDAALAAIDAYRQIRLDEETWIDDGRGCWERAIELSKWLKSDAKTRLSEIENTVFSTLDKVTVENGNFAFGLAELIFVNRLCQEKQEKIANKLALLAEMLKNSGEIHRARSLFKLAAAFYSKLSNKEASACMRAAEAESWISEAQAVVVMGQPMHAAAVDFYHKAIQIFRSIPRSERAKHRVEERIKELRTRLASSGEKVVAEMFTIKTPLQDISELAEMARSAVKGKGAVDAIRAFANLISAPCMKVRREQASEHFRNYLFSSLSATTLMSRDGRVIAKRPAMGISSEWNADSERALNAQMIDDYKLWIQLVVQGQIMPALWTIILEHRLREEDFISLAAESPIVPAERWRLVGKALFAGYELNFDTALHLLIPQLENMTRVHLKQMGANTTTIDKEGIETVVGLSKLMELPETNQLFGEDFAFELKSLFCDSYGPNLRNELAHGLLDDGDSQSPYAV